MFGMRASTPSYGRAFALSNVPNLVPAMSGSINTASVHNTSGDLVTNDIPSTFLIPSLHPELNKPSNEFNEGDFVFALNPRYHTFACGENYAMDYKSAFSGTATLVTLPQLNELLQEYTKKAMDEQLTDDNLWFTDPVLVREWARPLGVVLNKMRVNAGRNANGKTAHYGLNISVSRRANVKNNFMGMSEHGRDWFGQSTMQVAVQYSKELSNKKNRTGGKTDLVLVSMILVDSNLNGYKHRTTQLTIREGDRQSEEAVRAFGENPMGVKDGNVVTTIGRVLNSSMRSPTSFMALTSCYSKKDYDNLPPIEIELGCA